MQEATGRAEGHERSVDGDRAPNAAVDDLVVLTTTAPVAGGASLAHEPSGRVVFVAGALPGERVEATITESRRDFARAVVTAVVEAGDDRVEPPCPFVGRGCGGCDLQHVAPGAQPALKRMVVVDALRRIGRIADPVVDEGDPLPPAGFRTTVRCGVVDGRAGFRLARRHDVLAIDRCLVAHPLVDELIARGRFDGADEVTLRAGVASGERLVIADPTAAGVDLPDDLLETTLIVGEDELRSGTRAWFVEEVAGHPFRISASSFFQTRPDGAAALVDAVRSLGGHELAGATTVVDAYGGVGLFAATVVPPAARVTLVEANRSAVADAKHNLAGRDAKIVRSDVERWRPSRADVVIADPARTGLGAPAADRLVATGATVIVLVSCDAAALARDVRLLGERGYALERSRLVDLFPHTHHVEVVSRFVRADPS